MNNTLKDQEEVASASAVPKEGFWYRLWRFLNRIAKPTFNVLKWLSIPMVIGLLYYQIFVINDWETTSREFMNSYDRENWWLLPLVILMMPLNLGLEALKWQLLIKPLTPISFNKSMRAVFNGIALSLFTPKRVGEYGGRVLVLENNRMHALSSTFVGNIGQMVINIMVGLAAFLLFVRKFPLDTTQFKGAVPLSIFAAIALLLFYFNLEWVYNRLNKWKFIRKFSEYISVLKVYTNKTLFTVLSLSFLKYVVFIGQFVILVAFFGIETPWFWGLVCASCVFFAKTMLPLPSTVELAARSSIAIFFFSFITQNDIGIGLASILLWVINLALPALVGSYLLSRSKI